MAQKTNLNISPYFDDFDPNDQFYKVLFKPGYPVQARELSTIQSILQNQLESFGQHMFKDGSMVVPGNIAYDGNYFSMKIEEENLGVPVSLYLNELIGLKLTSVNTGVSVVIDSFLYPENNSQIDTLTIFVKYLNSGPDNLALFPDNGESLITDEPFTYGNTSVSAGETVLKLIDGESCFTGSAVALSAGIYFIRGHFVEVAAEKIVLNPYDFDPSYRVGLNIDEQLVTAKDDDSLYDNARGFSNFAAPCADRLKIKTNLFKKELTDVDDTNFVELLRIEDGHIKVLNSETQYNLIRDYFAKRTYEESGNYTLDKFKIDVLDCLNDGITGDGVYRSNELTEQGNEPVDDLMCVKVSSGKAYVKGYDVSLESSSVIDVQKPRDTQEVEAALVPYEMGTIFKVNNVFGVPAPNINDDAAFAELCNRRTASNTQKTGDLIGRARIYSFNVSNASYTGDSTEWDLRLFDIQIFTKILLNQNATNSQIPITSFIRGVSSGATGYVAIPTSGANSLHLSDVTGQFIVGEQIIVNEDTSLVRSIESVKVYGIQDVKSVYQGAAVLS